VIREERDRCVDRADSVFQPDGFRSSDLLLEFAKSDPRAEVACHIEESHVTVACVVDGSGTSSRRVCTLVELKR
jgi:hypothetical protein